MLFRKLFVPAISALVLVIAFQNCSKGFESATYKQTVQSSAFVSPEQLKAFQILSTNCKACHVDQALGNVTNILSIDHLLSAGLIVPGSLEGSPLLQAIESNRMPPANPLTEADKLALRTWIIQLGNPTTPPTPTGPIDLTFNLKVSIDPLPFRARLGKLSVLTGSANAVSLNKVKADRVFLGDYNFSQSILPKVSWESTEMKGWMEAMDPICSSTEIRNRFPWPQGAAPFLLATAGRAPTALDNTIIQEITALSIPATEKFDVFCMTILTSMEFVAK